MYPVKFKKLDPRAVVPNRARNNDSGYDLHMIDVSHINNDVIFFKTGLALQVPEGFYFEIFPRSSISKFPLVLANSVGVLDEEYRGEVLVALRVLPGWFDSYEFRNKLSTITPEDCQLFDFIDGCDKSPYASVAVYLLLNKPCLTQLVLKRRYDCEFVEVDELDDTQRGIGGFGSTDE